jgi:hypothetical protein
MIDVFYPYFQREAIWEELRYSLRSVERHLKADVRVWIVGDLPDWIDTSIVRHIHHKRSEGMSQNATFDAITKLMLFIDHPETTSHFIRMYDDIYLIGDATLVDIGEVKAMFSVHDMPDRYGTWWDQLKKTLNTVTERGLSGWNHETHLPELFHKVLMKQVIKEYSALQNRLLTSTLYFNTYYPGTRPLMFPDCRAIQFYNNENNRFYTSSDGDLERKCAGKIFMNHNNRGLNDALKQFLMNRFPNKCRFEI